MIMVSEVALSKIYSRFPQRSSTHGARRGGRSAVQLLLYRTVYSSTSTSKKKGLKPDGGKKHRTQLSHHWGKGCQEVHLLKGAQNFQCILQEVKPGISSERAVHWAFKPPRTTTWDVNEMPWGCCVQPVLSGTMATPPVELSLLGSRI